MFFPRWLGPAILALSALPSYRAQSPPVPPSYQDLYSSLNTYLDSFNATLNANWHGSKYPVLLTGVLEAADANAGPALLNPAVVSTVQMQLQELKATGIQAVMVSVNFPMLYRPFFDSQSEYQQFYAQVAAMIRAQGLKLIVEYQALLSNSVQAGWNTATFYASLTWDQYQAARAQTAVVVAQTMQPDYLGVLQEPDTESIQSGQTNVNTVSGATSLLSEILGIGLSGSIWPFPASSARRGVNRKDRELVVKRYVRPRGWKSAMAVNADVVSNWGVSNW